MISSTTTNSIIDSYDIYIYTNDDRNHHFC